MAAALDPNFKFLSLSDWSGGLNTSDAPENIAINEAQSMSNVVIDEKIGTFSTRGGTKLVITTNTLTKINLEYAFNKDDGSSEFIVSDSSIVLTTSDLLHFTKIRGPLTATSKLRALQVRNKVWFTNGTDSVFTWDGSTCMVLDGQTYTATTTPNVPLGKYIAYYHSRVWLYNVPGNNSALRYSAVASTDGFAISPDDVRAWPASQQLNVNQGDGQVGTGTNVYNSRLYAYKSQSKYGVFGTDEFTYFIRPTNVDSGASSNDAIVDLDGLHYYIDRNGIYQADDSNVKRISDKIADQVEAIQVNASNIVSYTWDTKTQFDRGSQVDRTTTTTNGLLSIYTQPQFLNFGPDTSTNPVSNFVKPLSSISTSTHWMVVVPTLTVDAAFPGTFDAQPFVGFQTVAFTFYYHCISGVAGVADTLNFFMQNDAIGISNQSSAGGVGLSANCSAPEQIFHANAWWTVSSTFTGRDIANGKLKIKAELTNTGSANYEIFTPTVAGNAQIVALPVSTGQYISEVSTFTPLNFWDLFTSVQNTGGGTINYFVRSASSSVNISTESWMPITPGNAIPLSISKPFLQWATTMTAVVFSTTNIDSVTIGRNEGGASDSQPFGIAWKNRYWLAVTTQAASTTPILFVKSRITNANPNAWMRFDGINIKSIAIYNGQLYGGSSTDGSIYLLDYGTNDNGAAISWLYKTPDLFFEQPFFEKDMKEVLVSAQKDNQTMYVDYAVDGGTNTILSVTLTGNGGRILKSLYGVNKKGKYFNFTARGATLDKPVEFHSLGLIYNLQQTR